MSDEEQTSEFSRSAPTEAYIHERFDLGEPLFSTRSAEAREGVDREGAAEVCFWVLRYPLGANSSAEQRFVDRLNTLSQLIVNKGLKGKIPNLRDFGVTDTGVAYVAAQYMPGIAPFELNFAVEERLAIFRSIVEVVASLHAEGVVCGDLSGESFVVDDENRVTLVGITGDFEADAKRTAALPPPETLLYVAPEQRLGGAAIAASDVFALGLIGYRFLTGNSPIGEKNPVLVSSVDELLSTTPAPSAIQPGLPIWIDEVLGRCLEERPSDRFESAVELLRSLDQSQDSGFAVEGGGRWAKRTVIIKPRTDAVLLTQTPEAEKSKRRAEENQTVAETAAPAATVSLGKLFVGLGMLALGVLTASGYFLLRQGESVKEDLTLSLGELIPPELAPSFNDLRASGVEFDQKVAALHRIAESANPASLTLLAQEMKGEHPVELKKVGFQLLIEKIRASQLSFTADIVRRWFEAMLGAGHDPSKLPLYGLIGRVCDQSLPLDARRDALYRAHAEDAGFALRLSAAVALDDPLPDRFVPVLRQLLVQNGTGGDLMGRGAGALILANRQLTQTFQADLVKALGTFSPGDLAWSLTKLAEMDSPLVVDLVQEVARRNIVPPYQGVFLNALIEADQVTTPRAVKVALVKSAQGAITEAEVIAIAGWIDIKRENALLAIAALSTSQDLSQSALEALAARELISEPAASLVKWVKDDYWESRHALAKPIGILGHLDLAKDAEVNYAFEQLMPFTADGKFLRAVTASGKSRILREAIRRMAVITESDTLLQIVDPARNYEPDVKIAAIAALKDRNDVMVLARIGRMYDQEKDEAVRKAYRESFWSIAEREKK